VFDALTVFIVSVVMVGLGAPAWFVGSAAVDAVGARKAGIIAQLATIGGCLGTFLGGGGVIALCFARALGFF
jgi:hypothetical protein